MNTMELGVAAYACPGCMHGPDPETCPKAKVTNEGCTNHAPGTMGLGIGVFYLGMPNGFNRMGPEKSHPLMIYSTYSAMTVLVPNLLSKFCVPAWKHLNDQGHTMLRWYSPRTNVGWSCVVLQNCMDKFPNVMEITQDDIHNMD